MILALDLATETGWALGKDGNIRSSGILKLKQGVWDGGGLRCLRLRRWLAETILSEGVEFVIFEKVDFASTTAASQMYGALMGAMATVCEELQVPYKGCGPGEWKKTFTGNGNAGKAAVARVAAKLVDGITLKQKGGVMQSDEADALGILTHGFKVYREV